MKKILLYILCGIFALTATAQEKNKPTHTPADRDTVDKKVNNEKKKVEIIFEMGEDVIDRDLKTDTIITKKAKADTSVRKVRNSNLFAGITFGRFDLGLAKMVDNGSSLSPENEFLDYRGWKSVNVGFDVAQIGYKFNDQFRMLLAAGFDWTHFRLNKDIIIKEDTRPLEYENSLIHYSKNRFSSSYLRIPLTFEIRSKAGTFEERLRFAAGPIAGILIQGSQKFKSKEEGKSKNVDDYNYTPFRYGAFARVGYGSFGIYTKYYFNDMFQNSPNQEGLKNVSFGLMFFF